MFEVYTDTYKDSLANKIIEWLREKGYIQGDFPEKEFVLIVEVIEK